MITRIDPTEVANASTVQVDSNAGNPWLAISEIEDWARQKGFVRTSEYQPRVVLIDGQRRYRCICYRISPEEREAIEQSHQKMIDRGDALRGPISKSYARNLNVMVARTKCQGVHGVPLFI